MVVASSALFAINGTISKLILRAGLDSPSLTELRATGACLGLLLLTVVTRPGPVRLRVTRRELPLLIGYGLAGFFLVPMLYFVGISRLPVGVALVWPFLPRDVEALAAIPRLGLEVELGTLADAPRGLSKALAPVEPDLSKPAGSAAPGPELPGR